MTNRPKTATQIAEELNGTIKSLDLVLESYGMEDALLDNSFTAELDQEVFECTQCNWWCEQSEMAETEEDEWICEECHDAET